MRPSSAARPAKPLSRSQAVTCAILNQFATPGLGSIIGGRIVAGTGQLLPAGSGFVMIVAWMVRFFYDRCREAIGEVPLGGAYGGWGKWGLILFGAGWLWALFTSLSLLRQAGKAPPPNHEPVPPRIGAPTGQS